MSGWRVFLLTATLSLSAAPAFAGHFQSPHSWSRHGHGVPEIDPAGLGSAATLLAGGAFLVGARTKRRRKAEQI